MTITSVQVLPGPGIVARYGDVLLWMEEGEGGGRPVVVRLLDVARGMAEAGDAGAVGRLVAEVLRSDPRAVPALVLVTPTPSGLRAIVHGWGRLLADGVDIDGGWTDREVNWTSALAAGRGGDLLRVPSPGSVLDLRRGTTPGGGAAVVLAARDSRPPPPAMGPAPGSPQAPTGSPAPTGGSAAPPPAIPRDRRL